MQQDLTFIDKELVLIGGGHAHVSVIKRFGMRPLAGVRVTVVSRDVLAPYSGMLPGYIAGHYSLEECHIDLGPLCQFANARFIHDEVVGLDLENKKILCKNRPPLDYDVLSINIGSSPDTSLLDKNNEVVPVKPISNFVERWQRLKRRLLEQSGEKHIAVVGGGAGGVELCLAMQYRLKKELKGMKNADLNLHFHLFDSNDEILNSHNKKVRTTMRKIFDKRGVVLHLGEKISEVSKGVLTTAGGDSHQFSEILWVTKASAQAWLRFTDLVLSPDGFISVDDTLQSVSHPGVFAAGDIADVVTHPRPKAGVFAVRQGPPLAENLRRALRNKSLKSFHPQMHFLSLISTGNRYALASKNHWMLAGHFMWRWKDKIDRRFMARFTKLRKMNANAMEVGTNLPEAYAQAPNHVLGKRLDKYYCAGCGSKVGKSILQKVLQELKPVQRDDVVVGLQEADDAALVKVDGKQLLVQTVDHFRSFIDDPYLFGKICTNHALSDLFAMGASPQTAMAMTTVSHGNEKQIQRELKQLLSGVVDALNATNCALVGGHTNEGKELALGVSVNGLIDPKYILRKTGLKPGDQLILTKPLGTGTLFAAHMRGKTKGPWIDQALHTMAQSNQSAAEIAIKHHVSVCTDVTGFGLMGHLLEMIGDSSLVVKLHMSALPILLGAKECLQQGIVSSLQTQNLSASDAVTNREDWLNTWQYQVLFDPQTSGGLLLAIPQQQVSDCLAALKQAGYDQAIVIGEVSSLSDSGQSGFCVELKE